jgi:hypothetical protein
MTEADWLACTDPMVMLEFLRDRAIDRKLRLFAVACSRRVWDWLDPLAQVAVEVAERFADGLAGLDELRAARLACQSAGASAAWYAAASRPAVAARNAAMSAQTVPHRPAERAAQAALLRDIFGNSFRATPAILPAILTWNEGCVVKLASSIYEERAFSQERMGVLADALEEAGVTDREVLGHLRGPGPHWRGCWLLDALLDKE